MKPRTIQQDSNSWGSNMPESQIDQLIKSETDDIIHQEMNLLRENEFGNDNHSLNDVDPVIRQELGELLERFHKTMPIVVQPSPPREVVPPENFSHVVGEIYRSSVPRVENFHFLQHRLKLKSVLVLIPEELPAENEDFLQRADIHLFQVGMSGNKEPFVNIPSDLLTRAMEIVLNPANQPILIHCNRGKHRTGCLIGGIRKLQNWSLTMIFDEYRRFAFPKARALDQQFIEMYDDEEIKRIANDNNWLPIQW